MRIDRKKEVILSTQEVQIYYIWTMDYYGKRINRYKDKQT